MENKQATAKKIGLIGCIATGIGCIIGSGIFGSLPTVINDIGPGVILALVGAVIYTLAKMIPNVYVSSVIPTSGSFFVAPTKLAHPALGMFMAAQNLLQPVLVSVFAVLFADYFVVLFPRACWTGDACQYCDPYCICYPRLSWQPHFRLH